MRPEAFAAQLERLAARGYRGATFSEVAGGRVRGRVAAVTFDDAFASVATLARPVLDGLGWPATVFAVTSFAASGAPLRWPGIDHWEGTEHESELAGLGWRELRELAAAGWEIGSHTVTHPRLTRIADDALARELAGSRAACGEVLGVECRSIAYPYGDVDGRVADAARAAGYATGAALPARWHGAHALRWPRVGVYHRDGARRFALKTSRAVRAGRRLADRARRA